MVKAEFNYLKHYQGLKNKLAYSKPSYTVDIDTMIVGTLGSIPETMFAILKKIGITEKNTNRGQSAINNQYSPHS